MYSTGCERKQIIILYIIKLTKHRLAINSMIRKILLSIASLFLAWQSINLIRQIEFFSTDNLFLTFLLAWVITLFVTGVFAFLVFAYPIENSLSNSYYSIRQPLLLKKWCNWLKIDYFRQALLMTLWKSKKQQSKYFNGRTDGLQQLNQQTKKSEWGHLFPFIIISFIIIYLIGLQLFRLSLFVLILNIVGNLYPILLQRHHRMRIQQLDSRYNQ